MLDNFRIKLATVDALPQLALLGIFCGLFSGAVIIAFRYVIETSQAGFLPQADPENYEALSLWLRVALPIAAGLLIGLLFQAADKESIKIGVVHVLERLAYHQAHMPWKNFVMQFVGAAISIIGGHSVGREGPGIHLGAATSSFFGQSLGLPNNSMRTLVACGSAASIAAAFNTPIAGVIFAMEVIVMEYTIAGFAPIILATVSATVLTHFVYGDKPAFVVPALELGTLTQLPMILFMGVAIGMLAALFIFVLQGTVKLGGNLPVWVKTTLAGAVVGVLAIPAPQIMGIGYDTVNAAMLGHIGLWTLTVIVMAKLFATTIGIGLGLPGGLIGPTLVIGAAAGAIVGITAQAVFGADVASIGFYAMVGMGSMMGAVLQAPLAALMALLELTLNTHIILPGMLAIVIAGITASHMFKQQGVFLTVLISRGLDYRSDPVAQSLRKYGVASVMERSFVRAERMITRAAAQKLLLKEPKWVVVEEDRKPLALLLSAELLHFLSAQQQEEIDLIKIPAQRYDSVQVNMRDTLQHALDLMDKRQVDAAYVGHTDSSGETLVHGILTRAKVESYYRFK
ncbi:chloride channel protein [Kaarinaea lacus]